MTDDQFKRLKDLARDTCSSEYSYSYCHGLTAFYLESEDIAEYKQRIRGYRGMTDAAKAGYLDGFDGKEPDSKTYPIANDKLAN